MKLFRIRLMRAAGKTIWFSLGLAAIFVFQTAHVRAANLISGSLDALDSAGIARQPAVFNNSERIGFSFSVTNTSARTGFIQFTFTLTDPQSRAVFSQQGNAVSSEQTGLSGTSISGVSVAQFYSVPGTYNLKATAAFSDGSESVEATLPIQIFSPLLTLTYPPNGAQNLTDQPLIFRWIGTGATKYSVTVADNPALFNPILTTEVFESQFSYPTNPSDVRQRLASGQVYYWSAQGLDAVGTKTSEAPYPYSFSISGGATQAQSKDLAIVVLEPSLMPPSDPAQVQVDVTVRNQGGRPESGVTVSVFAQGVLQSKQTLDSINVGEEKKLGFGVYPPKNPSGSGFLVSATLEGFFDDNLLNNSLTKMIPLSQPGNVAKAKILGSVWVETPQGRRKAPDGTVVLYDGPARGRVGINNGGEYRIDDLPLGEYALSARHPDFQETPPVTLAVTEARAYANRDLKLTPAAGGKTRRRGGGPSAQDKALEAVLGSLPARQVKELEGYKLQSIEAPGLDETEIAEIMEGIVEGKIKIVNSKIEGKP